jgi:succinate dehydrogenase/fumarate reductase flavoprotein subunit
MSHRDAPARSTRRDVLRTLALGAGAQLLGTSDAAPLAAQSIAHWDDAADLVIVGSGAAGISAALEARRHGLDVIVLERYTVPGGSSSLSGGVCYLGGGTPLQRALGFDDSEEEMLKYLLAACGPYGLRHKIETYCAGSLEHFDWLVAQGVQYAQRYSDEKELSHAAASLYYCGSERVHPYNTIARPAPRGHVPAAENQTGGRALMQTLLAAAGRAGVVVRTGVVAERLVLESDGRVAGLRAQHDGAAISLRARRGVVLAAGGFIHNPEMLARHAPELATCRPHWGRAGDLGDGIRMGIAAGAGSLHMNQGFAVLPLYPPEHVLKGIVVNSQGQRFINEDVYYGTLGHEVVYRQGGRAWLVVDASCDYTQPDFRLVVAATGTSVAELEQRLGIPSAMLERSVEYYNRYAASGLDPLFSKGPKYLGTLTQPPFKAYDLSIREAFITVHTLGGLETDVDGRVIGAWGEPIPGLYAAGRTTAGLPTAPYTSSGTSIGDGTFFGRRAARHAASAKT